MPRQDSYDRARERTAKIRLTSERIDSAIKRAMDLSSLLPQWAGEIANGNEKKKLLVDRIEKMWAIRLDLVSKIALVEQAIEHLDRLDRLRKSRRELAAHREIAAHLPADFGPIPDEMWLCALGLWRGFWITPRGTAKTQRYSGYDALFFLLHNAQLTSATSKKNFADWCRRQGLVAPARKPPLSDGERAKRLASRLVATVAKKGCNLSDWRIA